jgi:branched-chain amino acid transport system permease protein
MRAIPSPVILGYEFSDQVSYVYLVLAALLGVLLLALRLVNTAPGQALLALREDELAAEAVGIPTTRYKVAAFALGAGVAGIAGSLFAHYITYLSPENFTVRESMLALTMLIVGGRGNVLGSMAGAALLVALPEALRAVPPVRILVYGGLLTVMAVWRPQGILGNLRWGQEPPTWPPARGGVDG